MNSTCSRCDESMPSESDEKIQFREQCILYEEEKRVFLVFRRNLIDVNRSCILIQFFMREL